MAMPKNNLIPIAITRSDGVATTVWRKRSNVSDKVTTLGKNSPPSSHRTTKPSIDQALNFNPHEVADLPQPNWWQQFSHESQTNKNGLVSTPELLDMISSPIGDLAVIWQPQSQDDKDKFTSLDSGMDISQLLFKSVEGGEQVGYIKLSAMTDAAMARAFGTDEFAAFRYRDRYGNGSYQSLTSGDQTFTPSELPEIRKQVLIDALSDYNKGIEVDGVHLMYYNITMEQLPDDAKVIEHLEEFKALGADAMKESRERFSDQRPFVDYSQITDELQGTGLGTAMYIYAAKRLGKEGKTLRGSGSQSSKALDLWDRFRANFPDNVSTVEIEWYGNQSVLPILDFRS